MDSKRNADTSAQGDNIAQHAPDGGWALDHSTGELIWTDGVFSMFEIDPLTPPSFQLFIDTVHPLDRARVSQAYLAHVNLRTPYEISHRLLMPDGRIKWVSESCKTSYTPSGDPRLSIGTAHDITHTVERLAPTSTKCIDRFSELSPANQKAVVLLIERLHADPIALPGNVTRLPRRP